MAAVVRTDTEWLDGLRGPRPDERAVADLREYIRRGLVKGLGHRGPLSDSDLDDFAQDGVLRILSRLDSFKGQSKFTTWAMSVAIRVALTALRKRRWGNRSLEDLGISIDGVSKRSGPSEGAGPAQRAETDDVLAALREAIETELTPRQRAFIQAELAGVPTAVIAEQMGTNPNALYKLAFDARVKLRKALEARGHRMDLAAEEAEADNDGVRRIVSARSESK